MAVARQAAGLPPMPNTVVEPTRVFDNMYFIGMTSQNVWAITTSDGIILLDTLNSPQEAEEIMVADMKKVGLDPATASAPFVATLVDLAGIMIYFTIATLLLTGTLL